MARRFSVTSIVLPAIAYASEGGLFCKARNYL